MGYNQGAYLGKGAWDSSPNESVQPYVEADKASRTTAIFQGITGVINSAGDFYKRLKYDARPAAGGYNDPNVYYGGGVSFRPGESGEPTKLAITGAAGFTPFLLIGAIVVLAFFLKGK